MHLGARDGDGGGGYGYDYPDSSASSPRRAKRPSAVRDSSCSPDVSFIYFLRFGVVGLCRVTFANVVESGYLIMRGKQPRKRSFFCSY